MRYFLFLFITIAFSSNTVIHANNTISFKSPNAKLLLSELSPASDKGDWVEIFFYSDIDEKIDISSLYVTMYYGNNEPLSSSPITLYSTDQLNTPWDDRFAVIHLTDGATPDETDLSGDTNHNGILDIYCNNYSYSLWNSDCAAAIDADDDPSNGMIDFVVYSNNDDTFNSNVETYLSGAVLYGQWNSPAFSESAVIIPLNGLPANQVICRNIPFDGNSKTDWFISSFQTPGKVNIQSNSTISSKLFSLTDSKYLFVPQTSLKSKPEIIIKIHTACDIKLRIFKDTGSLIFESFLMKNLSPGISSIPADINFRKTGTGMYIGLITAVSTSFHKIQTEKFIIIISRY